MEKLIEAGAQIEFRDMVNIFLCLEMSQNKSPMARLEKTYNENRG